MRVYLASRHSRREELCHYRVDIENAGHVVTSRWLNGNYPETEEAERQRCALDDYEDVCAAEVLIAFTEPPRSTSSRGGRHCEMGIALGRGLGVWIVGPAEHVFCCLPQVSHYETWESAFAYLVGEDEAWESALLSLAGEDA